MATSPSCSHTYQAKAMVPASRPNSESRSAATPFMRSPATALAAWADNQPKARGLPARPPTSPQHGQVQALLAGAGDGLRVAGVGVAHHAGGRIVGQHALDAPGGLLGAVADDHHARVLRVADSDPAAMV